MMTGADMESRPDELCAIIPALNAADTIAEVVRTTLEYVAEVVVIDDMIATGGSMAQAIKAAWESGAKKVHVAATHAVFAGPVHERLKEAAPNEVIVTDTVPVDMDRMRDVNLTVLTIAPLLGEVIKRIHYNQSVSAVLAEYKARNFEQAY